MVKQTNKSTTSRLLSYLGHQRNRLTLVLFIIVVTTAISLVAPIVLGYAIDEIVSEVKNKFSIPSSIDISMFSLWMALLIFIYIVTFLLSYWEKYIMSSVAEKVALTMRNQLSTKLNQLPLKFYDTMSRGEVLSRATNDIERVADSFREGLSQLITTLVTIIGAISLMFYIYPKLALIAVGVVVLTIIITSFIARSTRKRYSTYQSALGDLNSNIEETFTGQLVIKAFNQETEVIQSFEKLNTSLYKASYKSQFATFLVPPVAQIISGLGYAAVALVSGYSVIQGRLTLGMVQAFIQYLYKSSEPIIESAYILNAMQSALASAKRLFEILDYPIHQNQQEDKVLKEVKGAVKFDHVKFGYSENKILLQDVNLDIQAGAKVAIVGPTGAGKTTLVNLLMRFYEIQGGAIRIDGVDTKTMSVSELRKNMGMVLQDTWLFEGTIKDNIAYSNLDASMSRIISAAKAARADHFITTLPEGYNTIINDDGSNISQGQKQLLTIARVIMLGPSILILDEATSSVDTRTEIEIQKAMHYLMKDRTSFIIAHRLSTIRDADLIIVMNQGSIVEQGSHEELLEHKGYYYDLYYSQFEQIAEDEQDSND